MTRKSRLRNLISGHNMRNAVAPLWLRRARAWFRDQKLVRKKRRRLREADAVVLSMATSGRTWLNAMLSHYYHLTAGAPPNQLLNADNFRRRGLRVPSVCFTHGREIDGQLELKERLRKIPLVFLHRDPRDLAVSMYFQRVPRKQAIGRDTLHLGQEMPDRLTAEVLFEPLWLPYIIGFMNRWRGQLERFDRTLFVGYEEVRLDPANALTRVLSFIDSRPVSAEAVQKAAEFASFENLRRLEQSGHFSGGRLGGGRPGQEGTWKVRRGKIGGFADYFTPAEIARIDEYVSANLDPSFGYVSRS